MNELGMYVVGMVIGTDARQDKNGNVRAVVCIAVGLSSYIVFMDGLLSENLVMGDSVCIQCRPFVTSRGNIGFGSGKFIKKV